MVILDLGKTVSVKSLTHRRDSSHVIDFLEVPGILLGGPALQTQRLPSHVHSWPCIH